MAKKKDEEVEETSTTSKKEVKSKPKKEVKTETPTINVEDNTVKTLLDWIDECEDSSFIFEKLMKHGYYQQYKTERELRKQDKFIPPKVTRSEFNRIMED